MKQRKIELLAPAKDVECGIAAIDHGADAVYIGAPQFGARVAAYNSLENIERLVSYAHLFGARVYVAVNTILTDDELVETEKMIWSLYEIGVDAIIVQDMGILSLNLPPIALHASTQTDNRTVEKVEFLSKAGFNQVVLARELTLKEIHQIHCHSPEVDLEVFIHGALCVSYSGQCYVSSHTSGRSANKGCCSQFCRLPLTLKDADNKIIAEDKHLLSLKDLNQFENLEHLLDAGVSSFKIEGRLKDISYVKNVTAAYSLELNRILKHRGEFSRRSYGKTSYTFDAQLDKSFNRGFTQYFLGGRIPDIASFDTPKSLGEKMGYVKDIQRAYFTVAGLKPFNNGDGACFVDENGKLQGFRINRVDENKLYPFDMPNLTPKAVIYRNFDHEFEKLLARESAERTIGVDFILDETDKGIVLTIMDEGGMQASSILEIDKEIARRPQRDLIEQQLQKLGNTPFYFNSLELNFSNEWFIPSSLLVNLRREVVEKLIDTRLASYKREEYKVVESNHPYPEQNLSYLGNVLNEKAKQFYKDHGVETVAPAFEAEPLDDATLMFTKHCIRYSMGWCPVYQKRQSSFKEPFVLVSPSGEEFLLEFDCKACIMKVKTKV